MKWLLVVGVAVASGLGGYFAGKATCGTEVVTVSRPAIRVTDTLEVAPKWLTDSIAKLDKALAKKPRLDTLYLAREVLVMDSFPYPISVKDTSSRLWWVERGTFGQKPGDVTSVVTREPKSGKASVLQYQSPGPVLSFVVDTSPRPNITFGKFVVPKRHHGLLTDLGIFIGGTASGFVTSQVTGCIGG